MVQPSSRNSSIPTITKTYPFLLAVPRRFTEISTEIVTASDWQKRSGRLGGEENTSLLLQSLPDYLFTREKPFSRVSREGIYITHGRGTRAYKPTLTYTNTAGLLGLRQNTMGRSTYFKSIEEHNTGTNSRNYGKKFMTEVC